MLRFYRRHLLFVGAAIVFAVMGSWSVRGAQTTGSTAATAGCPGKPGGTLATGRYEIRPVPSAVVSGAPMSGGWFEAGSRSYWHCHPGGQFLMVVEGTGRVQKRGERMRELSLGESEYAGPWVEHWHGAAEHTEVQYVQLAFQPTGTLWMEEVGQDDYRGNDIGIATRVGAGANR